MAASSLHNGLQQIGEFQNRLPGPVALLIGLAAAGVVFLPETWMASKHLYTMAHEGGHALAGSVMGRKNTRVTMKRDGTGLTESLGAPGFNVFLFRFFGYLAPSALGLGAAKLIEMGHISAVLWLLLVALVVLLATARGYFAPACIIVTGIGVYLAAQYALLGVRVALAYGIAWFLLISGVWMVLQHWRKAGDGALLKSMTGLPSTLWSVLWLTGSAVALFTGAVLLV